MPATYRRTSSAWKTLRGNTTANNLRTCETVSAGAFFFQPELEMPEKEVGQHTREHMMMPARILTDFIVVHPNSVFVSSKHCSIAHRTPLSHTNRRNGALIGALLR